MEHLARLTAVARGPRRLVFSQPLAHTRGLRVDSEEEIDMISGEHHQEISHKKAQDWGTRSTSEDS